MHDYPIILLLASITLGFGLVSKKAEHAPFTGPMVFVTIGILLSFMFPKVYRLDFQSNLVHLVAEVTLVSILFVDASSINLKKLIKDRGVPMRLLFVGLPI